MKNSIKIHEDLSKPHIRSVFLKIGRGEILTPEERKVKLPSTLVEKGPKGRAKFGTLNLTLEGQKMFWELIRLPNEYHDMRVHLYPFEKNSDTLFEEFLNWLQDPAQQNLLEDFDLEDSKFLNLLFVTWQVAMDAEASNPYC